MRHKKIGDREIYPALWITLAGMVITYLTWKYLLGEPAFPACPFYTHWHIYCPACGGTRAFLALLHGDIKSSLYYHPLVLFVAASVIAYLLSQTIWRFRGRRGFVLHYSDGWLKWCLIILLAHCVVRNFFWLGLHRPL